MSNFRAFLSDQKQFDRFARNLNRMRRINGYFHRWNTFTYKNTKIPIFKTVFEIKYLLYEFKVKLFCCSEKPEILEKCDFEFWIAISVETIIRRYIIKPPRKHRLLSQGFFFLKFYVFPTAETIWFTLLDCSRRLNHVQILPMTNQI